MSFFDHLGLGDRMRGGRQRFEGRVITGGPVPDDLVVGGVGAGASLRHPGHEGGVHLFEAGEGLPGQDVIAHDQHLSFDPALAGWPVGGQDVDVEVVMAGEADRLGMQLPVGQSVSRCRD